MARRLGWERLGPAQKSRYLAAGRRGTLSGEPFLDETEVRAYYESGGSLGAARGHRVYDRVGHTLVRPTWAAPREATDRAKVGLQRDQDRAALAKWRRGRSSPKWLPKSTATLRTDLAAILSELDAPPQRWTKVAVEQQHSGRWRLTITIRGRETKFVTTLPDRDSVSDLGRLLNDVSRMHMATGAERKRLEKEWKSKAGHDLHIDVDITGTDPRARRSTSRPVTRPPAGSAPALPRNVRSRKAA